MSRARAVLVLAALLASAGCHGEAEQAHRTEAGRIAHAVESLRNAPNEKKAPYLAALERTPCSVPDVCKLKQVCVDAYQRQLHALGAIHAARQALGSDAGPALARRAAARLDAAPRELKQARQRAQRCADLQGAVTRRYGL